MTDEILADFRESEIKINGMLRLVRRSRDLDLAEKIYEKMRSLLGQSKNVRDTIYMERKNERPR